MGRIIAEKAWVFGNPALPAEEKWNVVWGTPVEIIKVLFWSPEVGGWVDKVPVVSVGEEAGFAVCFINVSDIYQDIKISFTITPRPLEAIEVHPPGWVEDIPPGAGGMQWVLGTIPECGDYQAVVDLTVRDIGIVGHWEGVFARAKEWYERYPWAIPLIIVGGCFAGYGIHKATRK